MSKKRRKIKVVRELSEISRWRGQFELIKYRGQLGIREVVTLTVWDHSSPISARNAGVTRTVKRLLGYFNRKDEFCFFHGMRMTGNKRKYKAARKRIFVDAAGQLWWQSTNKDRKSRPCRLPEESVYAQFHRFYERLMAEKILLGA